MSARQTRGMLAQIASRWWNIPSVSPMNAPKHSVMKASTYYSKFLWRVFARNCLCLRRWNTTKGKKVKQENADVIFRPLSSALCHHSWDNVIKQMLSLPSQYFFTKICHLTYGFGFSCQLTIFSSLFHLNTNVLHKSQKKTWLRHPFLWATNHIIKWLNTSWFFPLSLLGPLQAALTPANLTKVLSPKSTTHF